MAGYIQYFKRNGIEYGELRVSTWDKNLAKVTKKTESLGRVIDKQLLIFKNRADGVYRFDLDSKMKLPPPEGYIIPVLRNKPRGISLKYAADTTMQSGGEADMYTFPNVLTCGEERTYGTLIDIYLSDAIESLVGVNHDSVKALLLYYCLSSEANCGAADWFKGSFANVIYPTANLSGSKITELLKKLGTDEQRLKFLEEFGKILKVKFNAPAKRVAIDSIGLSNNAKLTLSAVSNHNGEFSNEIRVILVIDRDTGLPVYYRCYPSNVPDMKTLETTFNHLKELSLTPEYVVLDASYSYKENIDQYNHFKIDFLTRIPAARTLYKDLVKQNYEDMTKDPHNIVKYNDRSLCIKKVPTNIDGNETHVNGFAYICLDLTRQALEQDAASGKFICGEIDEKELITLRNKAGLFILASTRDDLTANELMPAYYARQDIEQTFDLGKNSASMLLLNVQTDATFDGHMLISYISTILQKLFQKLVAKEFKISSAALRRKLRAHKAHLRSDGIYLSDVAGAPVKVYEILGIDTGNRISYPPQYLAARK